MQLHNLPRFRNLLSLHAIAGSCRECSRTEGSRMEGLLRGKTRTHPDSLFHLFVCLVGMMPWIYAPFYH